MKRRGAYAGGRISASMTTNGPLFLEEATARSDAGTLWEEPRAVQRRPTRVCV